MKDDPVPIEEGIDLGNQLFSLDGQHARSQESTLGGNRRQLRFGPRDAHGQILQTPLSLLADRLQPLEVPPAPRRLRQQQAHLLFDLCHALPGVVDCDRKTIRLFRRSVCLAELVCESFGASQHGSLALLLLGQ